MKNYPGKYRDSFTNHEVRIPSLNNQEFNQESEDSAFFFFRGSNFQTNVSHPSKASGQIIATSHVFSPQKGS